MRFASATFVVAQTSMIGQGDSCSKVLCRTQLNAVILTIRTHVISSAGFPRLAALVMSVMILFKLATLGSEIVSVFCHFR